MRRAKVPRVIRWFILVCILTSVFPISATTLPDFCSSGLQYTLQNGFESSVGAIIADYDGRTQLGTGFRISQDLILTAAHVVTKGTGVFQKPLREIRFLPFKPTLGLNSNIWRDPLFLHLKIVKTGSATQLNTDWAILRIVKPDDGSIQSDFYNHLAHSPPIELKRWTDEDQQKEVQVRVVGYPTTCFSDVAKLVSLTGQTIYSTSGLSLVKRFMLFTKAVEGIIHLDGGNHGDSGSPVLVSNADGKWQAIGILTSGSEDEHYGFFVYSSEFWDSLDTLMMK